MSETEMQAEPGVMKPVDPVDDVDRVDDVEARGVDDEEGKQQYGTSEERAKTWRGYMDLCLYALPWVGVQCIWATEFGTTTPYLEALGLDQRWASNIWLSGPLMGFFVAPIVGALSDSCHAKLGRRRPYMIGGLAILAVLSVLLAVSKHFGDASLGIAMTCFILLDGSINVIQTPLRAIIADLAPPSQQSTGQLMAVCFQGVGGTIGYFLMKWLYKKPLDVLVLFIVVLIINVVFLTITCVYAKEEHFPKAEGENTSCMSSLIEPFIHLFKSVAGMSCKLFIVGSCVFFCWWALFSWWPTSSTWYTQIVMEGCCDDPTDPANEGTECTIDSFNRCQKGLDANANAGIAANALQVVLGLILAILTNKHILVTVRFVWSGLLFIGCFLMIGSKWITELWFTYFVGIGMAFPISGINAFPFGIVGKYKSDEAKESGRRNLDVGAQFGLLNLFIVVPQIIVTVVIGEMRAVDTEMLSWALVMAGVSFGVGAIIAIFIKETKVSKDEGAIEAVDGQ